jgi:hypothetical protein
MRPFRNVRKHLRSAELLALLVLVAAALTWIVSGKAVATVTFQSPNPFESELPPPTVTPSALPTSTATSIPLLTSLPTPGTATSSPTPATPPESGTATSSPTSASSPTPEVTLEPSPTSTPPGFLPPPTLTSPGTPVLAGPSSPSPGELPVRVAPTETPAQNASTVQTDFSMTLASLIDQGVLALGYLWLCCGVLALIGIGGALLWFLRRPRRG